MLLQLMEGDNFVTPNTFYVKGKQKSLELHTASVYFIVMHRLQIEVLFLFE